MQKLYVNGEIDQYISFNEDTNEIQVVVPWYELRDSYYSSKKHKQLRNGDEGFFEIVCEILENNYNAVLLDFPTKIPQKSNFKVLPVNKDAVLDYIINNPPSNLVELARKLKVKEPTLKQILADLEKTGQIFSKGKGQLRRWYSDRRIKKISKYIGDFIREHPLSHKTQIMEAISNRGLEMGFGEFDLAFSDLLRKEILDYKEITVDLLPAKAWFIVPIGPVLEKIAQNEPILIEELLRSFPNMDTKILLSALKHLFSEEKIRNIVIDIPLGNQLEFWFLRNSLWESIFSTVLNLEPLDDKTFRIELAGVVESYEKKSHSTVSTRLERIIDILQKKGIILNYHYRPIEGGPIQIYWYPCVISRTDMKEIVHKEILQMQGESEEEYEREKIFIVDLDGLWLGQQEEIQFEEEVPISDVFDADENEDDLNVFSGISGIFSPRYSYNFIVTGTKAEKKKIKSILKQDGFSDPSIILISPTEKIDSDKNLMQKENSIVEIVRNHKSEWEYTDFITISLNPKVLDLSYDLSVLYEVEWHQYQIRDYSDWKKIGSIEIDEPSLGSVATVSTSENKILEKILVKINEIIELIRFCLENKDETYEYFDSIERKISKSDFLTLQKLNMLPEDTSKLLELPIHKKLQFFNQIRSSILAKLPSKRSGRKIDFRIISPKRKTTSGFDLLDMTHSRENAEITNKTKPNHKQIPKLPVEKLFRFQTALSKLHRIVQDRKIPSPMINNRLITFFENWEDIIPLLSAEGLDFFLLEAGDKNRGKVTRALEMLNIRVVKAQQTISTEIVPSNLFHMAINYFFSDPQFEIHTLSTVSILIPCSQSSFVEIEEIESSLETLNRIFCDLSILVNEPENQEIVYVLDNSFLNSEICNQIFPSPIDFTYLVGVRKAKRTHLIIRNINSSGTNISSLLSDSRVTKKIIDIFSQEPPLSNIELHISREIENLLFSIIHRPGDSLPNIILDSLYWFYQYLGKNQELKIPFGEFLGDFRENFNDYYDLFLRATVKFNSPETTTTQFLDFAQHNPGTELVLFDFLNQMVSSDDIGVDIPENSSPIIQNSHKLSRFNEMGGKTDSTQNFGNRRVVSTLFLTLLSSIAMELCVLISQSSVSIFWGKILLIIAIASMIVSAISLALLSKNMHKI